MTCTDPAAIALVRSRSMAWVRWYAGTLPWWIDGEILENVALLAVEEAALRFDPARGVQFTTYALPWVQGKVRHCVRDQIPGTRGRRMDFVSLEDAGERHEADFAGAAVERVDWERALAGLEPRERAALLARVAGEPQHVTAGRLRCSQMHVSRIQRQAIARMKEALSE